MQYSCELHIEQYHYAESECDRTLRYAAKIRNVYGFNFSEGFLSGVSSTLMNIKYKKFLKSIAD